MRVLIGRYGAIGVRTRGRQPTIEEPREAGQVGADVTEDERGVASIEVLHRMISYIREEARRLRVMDVAVLLEQAEEAVAAFAPARAAECGHVSTLHGIGHVKH